MESYFRLAGEALDSDRPELRLASVARQMVLEGDHDSVIESFLLLLDAVRESGAEEEREEAVLDVLDRLTGFCSPGAEI